MLFNPQKNSFRGAIKYFESAPPELGRSGDGKRTICQVQPNHSSRFVCLHPQVL